MVDARSDPLVPRISSYDWNDPVNTTKIVQIGDNNTKRKLAQVVDLETCREVVETLGRDKDPEIRQAIAQRKDLDVFAPDLFYKLAEDPNLTVQSRIAGHPHVMRHSDIVITLAKSREALNRKKIAQHRELDKCPEIIPLLACDRRKDVRVALARNRALMRASTNVVVDTVGMLARDESWEVRRNIAKNPALLQSPTEIQLLAGDEDWRVVAALLNSRVTAYDPTLMERFVEHPVEFIRQKIASLSTLRLKPAVAIKLSLDPEFGVRQRLATNRMSIVIPEVLDNLLTSNANKYVLTSILTNPNTPTYALIYLSEHSSSDISNLAKAKIREKHDSVLSYYAIGL